MVKATEHDVDQGWFRLVSGGVTTLILSSTYLVRFWRDPEGRIYLWGVALLFVLSLVNVVQGWRSRLVIRLDDEGIRMFFTSIPMLVRLFGAPDRVPPIVWAKIRSIRFKTQTLDRPSERTLIFDTDDGERRLTLVTLGARLKDPAAFLDALRSRGWDLSWPEDARWKIVPFSG
ncbi:hypothetical protein EON81_25180 [bacterium]|nr:MAG: hypothetical protein EON81_25180 [bacterium]